MMRVYSKVDYTLQNSDTYTYVKNNNINIQNKHRNIRNLLLKYIYSTYILSALNCASLQHTRVKHTPLTTVEVGVGEICDQLAKSLHHSASWADAAMETICSQSHKLDSAQGHKAGRQTDREGERESGRRGGVEREREATADLLGQRMRYCIQRVCMCAGVWLQRFTT